MEGLISIIVPVYNSARYIRDCVDSVLAQTYSCFEMLLIDDGSEDDSREVCERLCREDDRIRLIERPHMGVSAARNAGIREAKGKYVFFLDSDDAIHPRLLERLYGLLEKDQAVIGCVRYCGVEGEELGKSGERAEEPSEEEEDLYLESEKAIEFSTFANPDISLFGIGGKMILLEAAKKVKFREKLTHGEDTLFIYELLAEGADVSLLRRNWYFYRKHRGRATVVLSVKACRSRYGVLRDIRNQEIRKSRIPNAICWENYILKVIMEWYESGKEKHDSQLTEYVKMLAEREMKLKIFSAASRSKKIRFYMVFYCYPVLKSLPVISHIWKGWMWIWEKICKRICQKIWKDTWKRIWDIAWVKRWKWIWKWRRGRNAVWYGIKRGKTWLCGWIWKLAVKLKWKIKGRITWSKWMTRELWAKAWRIRNKVYWGWVWIEKTFVQPWKRLIRYFTG